MKYRLREIDPEKKFCQGLRKGASSVVATLGS